MPYPLAGCRSAALHLWRPALDRHSFLFARPPDLAVADGGFASRTNETAARARGVREVVLPWQPRESRSRSERVGRFSSEHQASRLLGEATMTLRPERSRASFGG